MFLEFHFDNEISLEVENYKSLKCHNTGGIYFHFGIKGELLYIGKASNIKKRLKYELFHSESHLKELVHNFKETKYFLVDYEKERDLLEKQFIKRLRPIFNYLNFDLQLLYDEYQDKYLKPETIELILQYRKGSIYEKNIEDLLNIQTLDELKFEFSFPVLCREKGFTRFPDGTESQGVYFFFGKENELLYIGISNSMSQRINEHMLSNWHSTIDIRHNFKHVKCITYSGSRNELEKIETYFIQTLCPKLNVGKTNYWTDRYEGEYNPINRYNDETLAKWDKMFDEFFL